MILIASEPGAMGAMDGKDTRDQTRPLARGLGRIAAWLMKLPIHAYRYSFKAFFGWHCRHLPTCSAYALDAIDLNGAWRGFWLTVSRLSRCHPWGTHGYDPAPDIRQERYRFMPWRYGRWTGRHLQAEPAGSDSCGDTGADTLAGKTATPPLKPPAHARPPQPPARKA